MSNNDDLLIDFTASVPSLNNYSIQLPRADGQAFLKPLPIQLKNEVHTLHSRISTSKGRSEVRAALSGFRRFEKIKKIPPKQGVLEPDWSMITEDNNFYFIFNLDLFSEHGAQGFEAKNKAEAIEVTIHYSTEILELYFGVKIEDEDGRQDVVFIHYSCFKKERHGIEIGDVETSGDDHSTDIKFRIYKWPGGDEMICGDN